MIPLLLLSLMMAAPDGDEDAAHRADRLRTQALNRQAAEVVARRDAGNGYGQKSYAKARADYDRRMAQWRAQVAACEQGDWRACD